ncbi:MAG: hypothetical protein PHW34_00530 [Hespellia sp.]|nr:hypothetical protein [Hespellia sp.]
MSHTAIKVIAIILFALAAAFLYGWGVIKSNHLEKDLYQQLYTRGANKVMKYLKKNEWISMMEIEKQVDGIKASEFYSKKKAAVQDKREFSRNLVKTMLEQNLIKEESRNGKKGYSLQERK